MPPGSGSEAGSPVVADAPRRVVDEVSPGELRELRDRLELRDLVEAYAHHVDRRASQAAGDLFTTDGVLRIFNRGTEAPVRERTGRAEIASAMEGLSRYDVTLHVVANHRVDFDQPPVGGAPSTARGEAYCLAHHVRDVDRPDGTRGPSDYVMHIRYLDQYARTDEGWRIAVRELQLEFTEDRPVSGP